MVKVKSTGFCQEAYSLLRSYLEIAHEQKTHADMREMSEELMLVDLQLEMVLVAPRMEVEQADPHVQLGQVNPVEDPLVLLLELCETCPWVCLETKSSTQMGLVTGIEEQVQELDPYQSDGGGGGGDGDGDGDVDTQPEVEEQD